ncbi:copper amine oxidase N-terminal domain-containing protein [Paenibacillus chibensis]|nr:copper amine oxidase N-terminal domain-containing protein [Paenibacillus chibensis]
MKKVLAGTIAAFILSVSSTAYAADMQIKIQGHAIASDVKPEMKNNRTMVPLRLISENLGAKVNWSGSEVTLSKNDMRVILTLKSKAAVKNGKPAILDAAPYIKNNRIMVPLRFIAETFNGSVEYTNSTVSVEPAPFVLDGVKVTALQNEVYYTMGSIVEQINGSAYNEAIYHIFENKGSKVDAPARYTSSVIELTSGAYYMSGQFDFLDQKGNSIKRFDVYTLSHPKGDPDVMLYDATENQWYLFTYSAVQSIYQFMNTAGQNGFLTKISDTNP